jgi:hypothetical protein
VGLTQSQGLIFLSLAELSHSQPDHRVTITTRELCKHSHTSEARLRRDTLELESRGLIRIEEGSNHQRNRYVVAWWQTVCAFNLKAPNAIAAAIQQDAENIRALARVAELHHDRISRLEDRQ